MLFDRRLFLAGLAAAGLWPARAGAAAWRDSAGRAVAQEFCATFSHVAVADAAITLIEGAAGKTFLPG